MLVKIVYPSCEKHSNMITTVYTIVGTHPMIDSNDAASLITSQMILTQYHQCFHHVKSSSISTLITHKSMKPSNKCISFSLHKSLFCQLFIHVELKIVCFSKFCGSF